MRRWVKVRRSAAGVASVTVTMIDGDFSVSWTSKTYTGQIGAATRDADAYARKSLDEIREAAEHLERIPAEQG